MSRTINGVPRELLERLQAQTESGNDWDEVQALLAAPVVERQEPVAWVHPAYLNQPKDGFQLAIDATLTQIAPMQIPLYAEQPAPVAVLAEVEELLNDMLKDDDQSAHWFAQRINACLDKVRVKELNR